jgi:hypothetical protein
VARLSSALPHRLPASNHRLLPVEKALAFMHGLLCDARKLTHAACLRRDPLVPELLGIERAASRKEGCTLDLDSTRLPPKDGHQEGVAGGCTRQGIKPCLHPLPAVLAGVRLAAQLWLRPGNTARGGNVTAFFLDLLNNLRGARADAGFCLPELPALWEQRRLPYGVVAALSQPNQKIIKGGLIWTATEVPGTEVSQLEYQMMSWPHPRRLVLIRHRVGEDESRGGKRLLDVPGCRFRALVTSLPGATHPPPALWRCYNGRADCENVIKELQEGFALPALCLEKFRAAEAALSLATPACNLTVLFQRHPGWQQKATIHSLRFRLFVRADVVSRPAGKTTIKLAVPERERGGWRRLREKILSPLPNCNALENRPAFSG